MSGETFILSHPVGYTRELVARRPDENDVIDYDNTLVAKMIVLVVGLVCWPDNEPDKREDYVTR